MKSAIHPKYGPSSISCACGNVMQTRSTKSSMKVDVCNNCHPYFTGKYKVMDTAGRIERFNRKYAAKPAGVPVVTEAPTK